MDDATPRGAMTATEPEASTKPQGRVILVVEDDSVMASILARSLDARGYRVVTASSGAAAIRSAGAADPSLILLDLGLPDMVGLEVCRQLRRQTQVPIIVVTADGAESHKVDALDEGADDYVTKPFSMPELLARIRASLRRLRYLGDIAQADVIALGDLYLDRINHRCTIGARRVTLTPKEFELVALMASNPGKILSHRLLLEQVWGPAYTAHHEYLRTYTSQLRKKLGSGEQRPRIITEPGVGYRMLHPGD